MNSRRRANVAKKAPTYWVYYRWTSEASVFQSDWGQWKALRLVATYAAAPWVPVHGLQAAVLTVVAAVVAGACLPGSRMRCNNVLVVRHRCVVANSTTAC